MKKILYIISLLLILNGCLSEPEISLTIDIGNELNDTVWVLTDEFNCEEQFIFSEGFDFAALSGEEVLSGFWSTDESEIKPKMMLWITDDNGAADCAGNSDSNSGDRYEFYYLIYKKNNDRFLYIYLTADQDEPSVIFESIFN